MYLKRMKKKLMAATSMLVISALMLTSASFAWLTISTAPEVTDIATNISTNENLEIALAQQSTDTADYILPADSQVGDGVLSDAHKLYAKDITWGNQISLAADNEDNSNKDGSDGLFTELSNVELKPVQLDDTAADGSYVFKTPIYGNDGRVMDTASVVEKKQGSYVLADNTPEANPYLYRIDYYLRTNTEGDIKLVGKEGVKRAVEGNDNNDAVNGAGSSYILSKKLDALPDNDPTNINAAKELLGKLKVYFVARVIDKDSKNVSTTIPTKKTTAKLDADELLSADLKTDAGIKLGLKMVEDAPVFTVDKDSVNQPILVSMYVYLSDDVTNADYAMLEDLKGTLSVQFTNVDTETDAEDENPDGLEQNMGIKLPAKTTPAADTPVSGS